MKPLCIDLYCGLGGWAAGFLAEGYRVIGFDVERHDCGTGTYPGQLVIQDVRTLHGSQFKDASVVVASPPCQEYSYRAMPWKRAKALPPPSNELFEACFRIQKEAVEAAGKYIPMIVENVQGAQKWVGRAAWHYGSYFLWGDVPALMPVTRGIKNNGGSWFKVAHNTVSGCGQNPDGRSIKGFAPRFYDTPWAWYASKSPKRKAASAQIAMIPFPLAQHIARVYRHV
jgi:site-specific DNA-cytosine methylase